MNYSKPIRRIKPVSRPVDAVVPVPGSKSITNRLLLLAALAQGKSRISGVLHSDDTDTFADALKSLGFSLRFSEGGDECYIDGSSGRIPAQTCPASGAAARAQSRDSLRQPWPPEAAVISSTPPLRCDAVPWGPSSTPWLPRAQRFALLA